jgi:hypothetical protein
VLYPKDNDIWQLVTSLEEPNRKSFRIDVDETTTAQIPRIHIERFEFDVMDFV